MSPLRNSTAIAVKALHDVGDSRRKALAVAKDLGFDETEAGKVALVVTEFATNLVKHGGGGTIVLRGLAAGGRNGVEVMSLDKGSGMDVELCLRDGYSTSGSPGTGLGAVGRIAHSFQLYSVPGKGTTLVAVLWDAGRAPETNDDVGAVCLPMSGETRCGDSWAVDVTRNRIRMMVCDGLGHGNSAADVGDIANALFATLGGLAPGAFITALNDNLRSTRGAALAVADIDLDKNRLVFAGIGNIGGYVFTGTRSRGMVSLNGIVGHQLRKVTEFSYDCDPGDLILMHSDGLTNHWKFEDYPGLAHRPAGVVAATFYRDFSRHKDDATILTLRRP